MYLEQSELLCCVLMVQVNVPPPDLRSVHITAASRPASERWLSAAARSSARQQLILPNGSAGRPCGSRYAASWNVMSGRKIRSSQRLDVCERVCKQDFVRATWLVNGFLLHWQ